MRATSTNENGITTIRLEGELDHHAAKHVMEQIGRILDFALPRQVTLDLSALSFMDSSGIAVLINLLRRTTALHAELNVVHVPSHAFRIFRAAGLTRMIRMQERAQLQQRR